MQNSADYYSNMLARQLFREAQLRAETSDPESNGPAAAGLIAEADTQEDLFAYAIFHNPGCGHQTPTETITHIEEQDQTFLRRWLSFYRPDTGALPQHRNLAQLAAYYTELNQKQAKLTSPRMAGLVICAFIAALLSLKSPVWLLLMPIAVFSLIWIKTQPEIRQNSQHIADTETQQQQQSDLLDNLTQQAKRLNSDYPPEDLYTLQQNYTHALETLLHESLRDSLPEADTTPAALREQLHAGGLHIHLLESRGLLQIPDLGDHLHPSADPSLTLATLVQETGKGWCALQSHPELQGLTRLHYVFCVMRTQAGIVVCSAYYDWVSNEMQAQRCDFYEWHNIEAIKTFDTHFPEYNVLADELPDAVYQLHFGEKVQVITLTIRNGDQYHCTLPRQQALRQTLLPNLPDTLLVRHLKRDARQLVSDLNTNIQGQQQHG